MNYNEIEVKPVSGNLGAEIYGVDLSKPINDSTLAEIRKALLEHLVIFFRDQNITPDQQKDFGRRFGELHIHPYIPTLEGHPEIIELRSREDGPAEMSYQSNAWHTDLTYTHEPPMGSILFAQHAPPAGGDTMFLNLYKAFETLSPKMQDFVSGLTAVHDITVSMPADFMAQPWAPKQLESLHKKTPPGRAPGGMHASGNRAETPVCEFEFHITYKGSDAQGRAMPCCTICTSMFRSPNSYAGSTGRLTHWLSGTTDAPNTLPSTTTTACASCIGLRFAVNDQPEQAKKDCA